MNPEHLTAFAQRVRGALLNADVTPYRGLVHRLFERRTRFPSKTRPLSTAVSNSASSPPPLPPAESTNAQDKVQSIPSVSPSLPGHSAFRRTPAEGALPTSCPGCGALTQEMEPGEAGYYTRSRKAVRSYFKAIRQDAARQEEGREDSEPPIETPGTPGNQSAITPVCDRCHDLIYNSRGVSIAHPSTEDIAESIAESPFARNHVYHVLDAADFPMSLIPSLQTSLSLAKPRSQNRRSQHSFSRKPTLSFIITRSDLLGPSKEMVDRMMPYFQSVLRDALGRPGRNMRLGNVHLVSAKRGWWTKEIKESIWKRGGGNWMVGKFNVGKSNLFEVLFPKGSGERAPVCAELQDEQSSATNELLSETSLLPPARPETPFPVLPLVSSLPGTTASPIRLSFGGHRGELIDLPGLERGDLDQYVQTEHRRDLVMTHRPNVAQHNIKPGQSLLLGGGLVRITPLLDEADPSTIMMAYPFVPIEAHTTSTEKAVGTQLQERQSGIRSILADGAGAKIASAGKISLATDVTKNRAASVLRAGVPLSRLPFRLYSTDILIEGLGWVELVCQVRRPRQPSQPTSVAHPSVESEASDSQPTNADHHLSDPQGIFVPFGQPKPVRSHDVAESAFPQVEIFTPNGQHVSQRPPLGAWQLWSHGQKQRQKLAATVRPRRPMKGAKKREKLARRAQATA